MTNIPLCSLDDLVRLERRPVEVEETKLYQEIGTYSYGRGIFHKQPRTGLEVGDKDLFLIKEGDFILQITFAWEGAVGLASAAEDGMYGSVRFPTFRVDESRCCPKYLLNYFKPHAGREYLIKISPGSAGRNRVLSLKRIPEVMVPLPPLAEQHRIVARIEELAAKIEEARSLRQQTNAETDRLLITMAHRSDLDQQTKIRAGWTEVAIGDVVREVAEAHTVKPDESYPNLGIYSFGRGLFHKPPIQGLATSANKLYRVQSGQFIYSRLFAFEGSYGWVSDDYDGHFVSGEYPTFDCDPDRIKAQFLYAYFKSPTIWKQVAVGSVGLGDRRQRVKAEQVLAHRLLLPPLAWQNQICEVMEKMNHLKSLQDGTSAELDALLPSILDKAFKGEL